MIQKMYSAFISSVYESLQDERNEVIDCLLDYRVFPVCMEHFTVSTNGKFSDIEELIDSSDFFILILGSQYGSCDGNGVSWTEREYDYAVKNNKHIIAIVCDELAELMRADPDTLTEEQIKQIEFCCKVSFARTVSKILTIPKIIGQFFNTVDFNTCIGWTRNSEEKLSGHKLDAWRSEHKAFDLAGVWYHVHLSADDEKYIRSGIIKIEQSFDPENYKKLSFDAYNYSLKYDAENHKIKENIMQRSHWNGDYTVDDKGSMFGVFLVKREFTGQFGSITVDKGLRRGIHDFNIDVSENVRPEMFQGEFHDEAPSPKSGIIYIFRTEEARHKFLEDNFEHVLLANGI